jgi:hypothetical protein
MHSGKGENKKPMKGLSEKQKKNLPKKLQEAILAAQKKKQNNKKK